MACTERGGNRFGSSPRSRMHVADEAHRIGLVVDREVRRVAELRRRRAAGCARRRSGTSRPTSCAATGPTSASTRLLHLVRGLVGERDGEDLERAHAVVPDQVRDPVREHPRLAGPGPGHDQQRAVVVRDRLALDGIQPAEQLFGVRVAVPHLARSTVVIGGGGIGHGAPILRESSDGPRGGPTGRQ